MRLRFRRIISLLPGLRINFGKKSVSASVGPRGAKVTVGTKGVRTTVGIPGTGVSVTDYRAWKRGHSSTQKPLGSLSGPIDQRQPNWEFYFLQSLLNDRIKEWDAAWQESTVRDMDIPTFCRWAKDHVGKLSALNGMLIKLLEVDSVAAVGPPGTPEKIVATVDGISELLKVVIQWEQEVRVFAEHPVFGNIARIMSGMSEPFLETLKKFKNELDEQIVNVAQTKRIFIHVKMGNLPHADACIKALESFEKQALEGRDIEGDFFQTQFLVNRGKRSIGHFSRRSVLENLKAGLFRADDLYWSETRLAWRSLQGLETEGHLEIADFDLETSDGIRNADPYTVLGVSADAEWKEIKEAYRMRCQEYHPDKMGALGGEILALAERKMKQINEAYSQLCQRHDR